VSGFGYLLVSKRCFATEEDHGIIKEAKLDTFFQAVGETHKLQETPPACRRETTVML
jgi:hypothetical protein